MRSISEIRAEIEGTSQRRGELWNTLGGGHDKTVAHELKQLDESLARLWDEHRAARARIRFGEREKIVARARAEERLARAA